MATSKTDRPHRDTVPRAALIGAALLLTCTMLGAYVARTSGLGAARAELAPTVRSLDLRFLDLADGSVQILGIGSSGEERSLAVAAPGADGFMRGVVRGLARERRRSGAGAEAPFRLSEHADGAITLLDPSTGQRIDLRAFGPTNTEAFARLLRDRGAGFERLSSLAAIPDP